MCVQLVYNYTPFLFTGIKKDTRERWGIPNVLLGYVP